MKIFVRLFAQARDLAGAESVEIDISEPATIADLKQSLCARYPSLTPMLPQLLMAIDSDYVTDDAHLQEGANVACFPPVSGG